MTNTYILIDNNHPQLTEIRTACYRQHAIQTDNRNLFSEVLSYDDTQRLVKVAGLDLTWLEAEPWYEGEAKPIVWRFGIESEDLARQAWLEAQEPEFDLSNPDGAPDTMEERRSWWQRLLNI